MNKLYRLNGEPLCLWHKTPPLFFSLFLFLLSTFNSRAQVNSYAKVTAIANVAGKSQLTITNVNQTYHTFAVGEDVLIIQMQDNVISGTTNTSSFGNLSAIGKAGLYEVGTINAVTASTITLNSVLNYSYAIGSNSNVQVVSFAKLSATNYTTTANITAVPWSGSLGRGGVVAFQVPGTLTLKNSITADGAGFAGGVASNNTSPGCGSTTYISNSTNYGAKGEGIYLINTATDPTFVRGRAHVLSGGGGGNSGSSGGGGGSNFTAGGDGLPNWFCGDGNGFGGIALGANLMSGTRVFLGGGGGGGQGIGSQTAGANGGGIIILKVGTLTTSCGSPSRISANGNSAGTSGGDGAGGGGAAGTIFLQVGTYSVPGSCALTIQANGGDGGDAPGILPDGAGGGGGQGAILIVGSSPTTNITKSTNPGNGGSTALFGSSQASPGAGTSNAGVIGGIGVVLPVRIIYFGVENKNNKVVLNWTSADESDITYNIEHSTDGINFTNIGRVTGTGKTNYTYTDPDAEAGINYYRLVMTGNLSTQAAYSSIVSINLSATARIAVAYPNPAQDHFYIKVPGDNNSIYTVAISDLTGKLVYSTTVKSANNIITVTPGSVIKPGLYMFKVASNGNEQTGKLMIK